MQETQLCELENPRVLVTDRKIGNMQERAREEEKERESRGASGDGSGDESGDESGDDSGDGSGDGSGGVTREMQVQMCICSCARGGVGPNDRRLQEVSPLLEGATAGCFTLRCVANRRSSRCSRASSPPRSRCSSSPRT